VPDVISCIASPYSRGISTPTACSATTPSLAHPPPHGVDLLRVQVAGQVPGQLDDLREAGAIGNQRRSPWPLAAARGAA